MRSFDVAVLPKLHTVPESHQQIYWCLLARANMNPWVHPKSKLQHMKRTFTDSLDRLVVLFKTLGLVTTRDTIFRAIVSLEGAGLLERKSYPIAQQNTATKYSLVCILDIRGSDVSAETSRNGIVGDLERSNKSTT